MTIFNTYKYYYFFKNHESKILMNENLVEFLVLLLITSAKHHLFVHFTGTNARFIIFATDKSSRRSIMYATFTRFIGIVCINMLYLQMYRGNEFNSILNVNSVLNLNGFSSVIKDNVFLVSSFTMMWYM